MKGTALALWLDLLDKRIMEIWNEYGSLYYHGFRDSRLDTEGLNILTQKYRELLGDPSLLSKILSVLQSSSDKVIKRKAELLRSLITQERVESSPILSELRTAIMNEDSAFRPVVSGENIEYSERRRILCSEADRDTRREAYYSTLPLLHQIEEKSRKSIKVANELVKLEGIDNYFEFSISFENLGIDSLKKTFSSILNQTSQDHKEFLKRSRSIVGSSELQSYDLQYTLEKITTPPVSHFPADRLLDTLKKTVEGFSIDFDSLPITIEMFDTPNAGTCFVLGPDDIRLVLNPDDGYFPYYVAFHEFGHALHKLYRPDNSAILSHSGLCAEGLADLFAGFIREPEWLSSFTEMTGCEIDKFLAERKLSVAYKYRDRIRTTVFEYEIHRQPDTDFFSKWNELTEEYLGISSPDPIWDPFSVYRPSYVKNYIYSELFQRKVMNYLRGECGKTIGNPAIIKTIKKIFYESGNLIPLALVSYDFS
jgi:oligoendopeptidase F